MKILYIYTHPDDESFGPAHVMSKQRRAGHEVCLLTLTKGGATRQRFKYGYSTEKMGEVRFNEMKCVSETLNLSNLTVLDFPDSKLKELDPRVIENAIRAEIERLKPDVVATYAVHGISGFHDHLVTHAAVKRVYVEMNENLLYPKRLVFVTITEEDAQRSEYFHLNGSKYEEIDCIVEVDDIDIQRIHKALDCYVTFQDTIEKTGIKDFIGKNAVFEIFQEQHEPPLRDLFEKL